MRPSHFGWALEQLKEGKRVCRAGWNGKGMWLMLVPAHSWTSALQLVENSCRRLPFIAMKTADDGIVPWLASQTDVLAEDWDLDT